MKLSGNRYDEIEKEVIKLFSQLVINNFPLDLFDICNQLGIVFMQYSMLSESKRKALKLGSEDACHALWEISQGEYVNIIYYNDSMPECRIRFTIMHEIGHIILDHTEHSELAESEANYFAKYALAPPPLVHNLKIEDYIELADVFDLSYECAFYSMQKYTKWLKCRSLDLLEYEIKLITLFQPVLLNFSSFMK